MTPGARDRIAEAWREVSGSTPDEVMGLLQVTGVTGATGGPGHRLSCLPVEDIAMGCVGAALLAAAKLQQQRNGTRERTTLDRGHVAAAVRSERLFRCGGQSEASPLFAPLSRFWPAADGWVRTHANYSWHRAALLQALGTTDAVDAVANAIATKRAEDVEAEVFAAGGVAAAVRSVEEWRAHRQGEAVGRERLISTAIIDGAAPKRRSPAAQAAAGVRVLDVTRVIAGPVCTRFLGALGADVLRLDPPAQLDMRLGEAADTLLGKRSSLVDFGTDGGVARLHALLDGADVLVCGYRPGALDRFGLGETAVAERHPGLVVLYLNAWGHGGPWTTRRGFDSIVQAATGIASLESAGGGEPGVLPCQLLDHGTGYLAAAAVLDGLRRQSEHGGTIVRRVSLARTAWWLTSARSESQGWENAEGGRSSWLVHLPSAQGGLITAVPPPGALGGRIAQWSTPVTTYGGDAPSWREPGVDNLRRRGVST